MRRSEESLKQSERRFRNYFEQGLIGMAVTSLDGHWLEVNERLCQILGYGREELLQKTWTQLTYPEDIAKDLAEFNRLLAGELDHYQLDKRFIRKDGNLVYTTIQVRAFQKEDGSIDHIVGLIEDITARKRAEEALERERQSLWRMLQASDHERRLISYEIHDGLAQYLAAAGMQFQSYDALRDNSPDEATKAYQTAVELVRQAHFEARHLVSEVRPPVIDEIGLETAISHLVHEQRRHGGPNIELHSNVQFKRLASILENAIYRIVQEALSNACKHSQSKKVTVSLTQEGQEAWLRVQDWGVGFDPESVGNGHFGLEGIRQRVRLLGGRLTIESAPSFWNHGSGGCADSGEADRRRSRCTEVIARLPSPSCSRTLSEADLTAGQMLEGASRDGFRPTASGGGLSRRGAGAVARRECTKDLSRAAHHVRRAEQAGMVQKIGWVGEWVAMTPKVSVSLFRRARRVMTSPARL